MIVIKDYNPCKNLIEKAFYLESLFYPFINLILINKGILEIYLKSNNKLNLILKFLKYNKNFLYNNFIDLIGIDLLNHKELSWYGNARFSLVYNFISTSYNSRLFLNIKINNLEYISTIEFLYPGASWAEREVYDLFGILFANKVDQRRILTDYGLIGHPLKKDYPLGGFMQVRWDEEKARIIYEPFIEAQTYRTFTFQNPWN